MAVVYVLFSHNVLGQTRLTVIAESPAAQSTQWGSPVYLQLLPPTNTLKHGRNPPPPSFFKSPLPFLLPLLSTCHLSLCVGGSSPLSLSIHLSSSLFLQLPCIIKFLVEVCPPSYSIFSSPFLSTSFCLPFLLSGE